MASHPWRIMVPLVVVQFLSWAAMFCLWIYAVPVIAGEVIHAEAPPARMAGALAVIGGLYALYAVLGAGLAFALPEVLARAGVRVVYSAALAIAAAGIAGVGAVAGAGGSAGWLVFAFIAIGVGWGVMGQIPYAVVSAAAPPGRGAHWLRLFGFSTVAPQVLTTLGLALAAAYLPPGTSHRALYAGGGLMAAASLVAAIAGGRFAVGPEDW